MFGCAEKREIASDQHEYTRTHTQQSNKNERFFLKRTEKCK